MSDLVIKEIFDRLNDMDKKITSLTTKTSAIEAQVNNISETLKGYASFREAQTEINARTSERLSEIEKHKETEYNAKVRRNTYLIGLLSSIILAINIIIELILKLH